MKRKIICLTLALILITSSFSSCSSEPKEEEYYSFNDYVESDEQEGDKGNTITTLAKYLLIYNLLKPVVYYNGRGSVMLPKNINTSTKKNNTTKPKTSTKSNTSTSKTTKTTTKVKSPPINTKPIKVPSNKIKTKIKRR